jgi:formylglycine-generating enzyme required for sulfatase activity
MRRFLLLAALVLLIGVCVAWKLLGLPQPGLVLKYGFPPTGGPTGRTLTVEGVEFVELRPGYCRMGSHFLCKEGDLLGRVCSTVGLPWGEQPEHQNECPLRWVKFADGFWIARTELTNEQYDSFWPARRRDTWSPGDNDPRLDLEVDDAWTYCVWLSEQSGLNVRLPSESEWECACRAGSDREFCFGDDEKRLGEYGWYGANAEGSAHEVGTRRANAWGLQDLHGNVWEWCEDT